MLECINGMIYIEEANMGGVRFVSSIEFMSDDYKIYLRFMW